MANVISNYRDAFGADIQPYYAAYMIEFGYRSPAEAKAIAGGNFDFMAWIGARWNEFFASKNMKTPDFKSRWADEFTEWLNGRALSQLARQSVEAA